jgi:5S rRNA maturation endonuclease (ribonuclease M5)
MSYFLQRKIILVEGPEDKLAITEALKTDKIKNRTEELDITIIMTVVSFPCHFS